MCLTSLYISLYTIDPVLIYKRSHFWRHVFGFRYICVVPWVRCLSVKIMVWSGACIKLESHISYCFTSWSNEDDEDTSRSHSKKSLRSLFISIGHFIFELIWITDRQLNVHNDVIRYQIRHSDVTYYVIIMMSDHNVKYVATRLCGLMYMLHELLTTNDVLELHSCCFFRFIPVDVEVTQIY